MKKVGCERGWTPGTRGWSLLGPFSSFPLFRPWLLKPGLMAGAWSPLFSLNPTYL